jgi:quinol monooxygenase YgiN
VEIKPETTAEFREAMRIDAGGSRTEPGCYRFDVLQDKSDPNKYLFYEVYENDGEAVAFHRAQPHFKAWGDFKAKYGIVSQTVVKADAFDFTEAKKPEAIKYQDTPGCLRCYCGLFSLALLWNDSNVRH